MVSTLIFSWLLFSKLKKLLFKARIIVPIIKHGPLTVRRAISMRVWRMLTGFIRYHWLLLVALVQQALPIMIRCSWLLLMVFQAQLALLARQAQRVQPEIRVAQGRPDPQARQVRLPMLLGLLDQPDQRGLPDLPDQRALTLLSQDQQDQQAHKGLLDQPDLLGQQALLERQVPQAQQDRLVLRVQLVIQAPLVQRGQLVTQVRRGLQALQAQPDPQAHLALKVL